jgi:hypothetical protein
MEFRRLKLNPRHPLAEFVTFAFVPGVGVYIKGVDDLEDLTPTIIGSPRIDSAWRLGAALTLAGGDGLYWDPIPDEAKQVYDEPHTCIALIYPDETTSTGRNWFAQGFEGVAVNPYTLAQTTYQGREMQFGNRANQSTRVEIKSVDSWTADQWTYLVVDHNGPGGAGYQDGSNWRYWNNYQGAQQCDTTGSNGSGGADGIGIGADTTTLGGSEDDGRIGFIFSLRGVQAGEAFLSVRQALELIAPDQRYGKVFVPAGGGVSFATTKDALTVTEYATTIGVGVGITATKDALSITEYAAGFSEQFAATKDALSITEYAAGFSEQFAATKDALSITEYSAAFSVNFGATKDALTVAEYATTISTAAGFTTATDSLTVTEYATTIGVGVGITATKDDLTITEYVLGFGVGIGITATKDALTITEYVAGITSTGDALAASADRLLIPEADPRALIIDADPRHLDV